MSILSDRIKEQRLKNGLTLLQVAELLNIKEATAQRYESGEIKNIKHETIAALADIFQCSPSYLMGWTNSPFPDNNKEKAGSSKLDIELIHVINKLSPEMKEIALAQLKVLKDSQNSKDN
ncbi:MAG: helix-turn-helix transcriptional regulator [Clostridiales bacterium]|nr:helix-turn-helix transcriptional regulator [Clostridiales bacterium]